MTAGELVDPEAVDLDDGALFELEAGAVTGQHHDGERRKSKTDWSLVDAVVLSGGPRPGEWFIAADWAGLCGSATAMGRTAADQCGWPLGYAGSTERREHPTHADLKGRVWLWAGRPEVRKVADLIDPRGAWKAGADRGVSSPVGTATADRFAVQDLDQMEGGPDAAGVDDPRGCPAGRPVDRERGTVGERRPVAGVRRPGRRSDRDPIRCEGAGGAGGGVRVPAPGQGVFGRAGGTDAHESGGGAGDRGRTDDAGPSWSGAGEQGEGRLDVGQKETTPEPRQRLGVFQVTGDRATNPPPRSGPVIRTTSTTREAST